MERGRWIWDDVALVRSWDELREFWSAEEEEKEEEKEEVGEWLTGESSRAR